MLERTEHVSYVSVLILGLLGVISSAVKWWLAEHKNSKSNDTLAMSDGSTHDSECGTLIFIKNNYLQTCITVLSNFCTNGALMHFKGTLQMEPQ